MTLPANVDAVNQALAEQRDYYQARACEYDEWWLRMGRYDRGPDHNQGWFADITELDAALLRARPSGRILELAGGTGIWSAKLLPVARELTVVDGSAECLKLNRARLRSAAVRYIETDLFQWRPDRQFDFVFFSFWLSHVPESRFAEFWDLVANCLAPGGRAFFIDSLRASTSTSVDQQVPRDGSRMKRVLNDGRTFQVFKVYYEPAQLQSRLSAMGWQADVGSTTTYFVHGSAQPGASRREVQP